MPDEWDRTCRVVEYGMKKLLLYGSLIALLVVGAMAFNVASHTPAPANISADSIPSQPWQPARLQIPAIHVDAPIIFVGKTASGAMNAPVSHAINSPYWSSVFWYDLGAAPGQAGNAVIAGHVDRVGGDPAIFWFLKDLVAGDTLSIATLGKATLHFVVNRVVSYPAGTRQARRSSTPSLAQQAGITSISSPAMACGQARATISVSSSSPRKLIDGEPNLTRTRLIGYK